ncbi:tyrosine-type recombinase/integrase [Zobellella maritima]|uniref:tyrosine-type recombinase/integrase n=1 Tax=Zobellella maritima TaxID=2059725 RepID=UPI000E3035B1|nr:site-specific integrase [Zobellella maritima]
MASNLLNDNKVKKLIRNPPERETWVADGDGLAARLSKTGALSWYYRYRLGGRNTKLERLLLGKYPDLSLAAARKLRDQCREWLANNEDPRFKLNMEAQEALKPVTVRDALEYWLDNYAVHHRANHDKHRRQLAVHIFPHIGSLPLNLADRRQWLTALERISHNGSPVAAGYVLQMCKQALRYCDRRGYAASTALEGLTIPDVGKKQGRRDRVLTDAELGSLWQWLNNNGLQPYYRDLLRLITVFCARTKEVRLSKWDEWDLDARLWTIPEANSKTKKRFVRPIPERVIPWLEEMRRTNEGPYLLGTLKKSEAVSQNGRTFHQRLKHREPWTLHNLRHTFITKNADLGAPPHVVELLAGHELGGVFAIYNRSQYLPEKLDVLNRWLDRLELLADTPNNVIPTTFNRTA